MPTTSPAATAFDYHVKKRESLGVDLLMMSLSLFVRLVAFDPLIWDWVPWPMLQTDEHLLGKHDNCGLYRFCTVCTCPRKVPVCFVRSPSLLSVVPSVSCFFLASADLSRTLLGYSLPTGAPDLEDAKVSLDAPMHYVDEAMRQQGNTTSQASGNSTIVNSSLNVHAGRFLIERIKAPVLPVAVNA